LKKSQKWLVGLGLVVLVGSCQNALKDSDSEPSTSTGPSARGVAPAAQDYCAYSSPGPYLPDGACRQGGEIVTVQKAVDGDTLELADGRRVRLLGVDAPAAKSCAGPGATAYTQARTEGEKVKLLTELGVEKDQEGYLLRYVQTTDTADTRTNLPIFAEDVGQDLVLEGWALPNPGRANTGYMEQIESAKEIAEYRPEGIYAPPCGKPKVYGDENGDGSPDWEVSTDGDDDDHNMRDGALTGGFCARKRWC
jgi:endonuclease YncB( thermonuclease family)